MQLTQTTPEVEVKEEPKLSRNQRRQMERFNEEVQKFNQRLCNRYYQSFIDNDPDGPEIEALEKEISAKWKMYCHNMRITDPEALNTITTYCSAIKAHYHEIKNNDKAPLPTESTIAE